MVVVVQIQRRQELERAAHSVLDIPAATLVALDT
jgi:hypothetical protein